MGIVALGPAFESGLFAGTPRGHVLKALCNNADDDSYECWPSYEFIAFTAGIGRSTAAREIKALIRLKLLEIVRKGGGRRRSNLYRVNVPLIEACRDRVRAAKRAAPTDSQARIEAMEAARKACENDLENSPWAGRFVEKNRPADDQYRPAHDNNTVPPVDPNLHKNLQLEKTRAREASPPVDGDPDDAARPPSDGDDELDEKFGDDGKPLSENERKARIAKRNLQVGGVVEWICGGYVSTTTGRWLGLSPASRPAEMRAAVLALDGSARTRAESFVVWAQNIVAGRPQKQPIREVLNIIAALTGPHGEAVAARCAELLPAAARERAPP